MEILKSIFEQLTTRELAIIIWSTASTLPFLIFSKKIRGAFWDTLKRLFSGKILFILIMNAILFVVLIVGIKNLQLWNDTLWKDATFWFSASFIMLFNTNRALSDSNYYKKEFLKLLKWEAILIFFISLYPFSLIKELFFVPAFTFLVVLQTVASSKKELKQAETFLGFLTAFVVLFLIGYSIKEAFYQLEITFSTSNLYSFVFPLSLTIIYIPFLYIFSLYMAYESFFCKLSSYLKSDYNLKNKLRIILTCGTKISNVKNFQHMAFQEYYVRSEADLIKTINSFKNANE